MAKNIGWKIENLSQKMLEKGGMKNFYEQTTTKGKGILNKKSGKQTTTHKKRREEKRQQQEKR